MLENYTPVEAELVSIGDIEAVEIILLTGGLCALTNSEDETVIIYPILSSGQLSESLPIPQANFRSFIKDRGVEVVGVKEITIEGGSMHWRWAPAIGCESAPDNNPSYRWGRVASSIRAAITRDEKYSSYETGAKEFLSADEMEKLELQARHISIALHQLNFSIVNIAEYFQKEVVARIGRDKTSIGRYSHIRSLDLAPFVHNFFQAFSAARDHYAIFLAVQISKQKVAGDKVDSMGALLNLVRPEDLRRLKIVQLAELKNLLCLGEGLKKSKGEQRLVLRKNTWFWDSSQLRNRFTHRAPYGSLKSEGVTEIYSPEMDSSIISAKSFLCFQDREVEFDLLRTTNAIYQRVCGLFLSAADLTGYITEPPRIVFS